MAGKVLLGVIVVVMFCRLPAAPAAVAEMESKEMKMGVGAGLCSIMEKGFHAYCFTRPPPNRFCNVLGVLLKDLCHINPPCLMATTHSACLPKFLCKGHTLPYGACPQHFVCCYSFSDTTNFTNSANAIKTNSISSSKNNNSNSNTSISISNNSSSRKNISRNHYPSMNVW